MYIQTRRIGLFLAHLVLKIGLGHFVRRPAIVSYFFLSLRVCVFNSPANRSAGHGRDNARSQTTQEALPPKLALDNGRRVEQAPSTPNLLVGSETARL